MNAESSCWEIQPEQLAGMIKPGMVAVIKGDEYTIESLVIDGEAYNGKLIDGYVPIFWGRDKAGERRPLYFCGIENKELFVQFFPPDKQPL